MPIVIKGAQPEVTLHKWQVTLCSWRCNEYSKTVSSWQVKTHVRPQLRHRAHVLSHHEVPTKVWHWFHCQKWYSVHSNKPFTAMCCNPPVSYWIQMQKVCPILLTDNWSLSCWKRWCWPKEIPRHTQCISMLLQYVFLMHDNLWSLEWHLVCGITTWLAALMSHTTICNNRGNHQVIQAFLSRKTNINIQCTIIKTLFTSLDIVWVNYQSGTWFDGFQNCQLYLLIMVFMSGKVAVFCLPLGGNCFVDFQLYLFMPAQFWFYGTWDRYSAQRLLNYHAINCCHRFCVNALLPSALRIMRCRIQACPP